MSTSFHLRTVVLALALAGAAGCSSPNKSAIYEREAFSDAGTFSRNYGVSDTASCEAARRALLSQGYIITSSDPKLITGNKSFQQTGETHMQISFSVVCAADGSANHRSTMFANALQDRYALKKVNNSASLGVGVLGSVSMPIGSTDDSMVKVASETVSSATFYERFFTLVELFLPPEVKKEKHTDEKPKAELGVPEATPAKAPADKAAADKAAADKAPTDKPAEPKVSEPKAAPAKPLEPTPVPTPTPTPTPTPAPVLTPTPAPKATDPVQSAPVTPVAGEPVAAAHEAAPEKTSVVPATPVTGAVGATPAEATPAPAANESVTPPTPAQ